MQNLSSGKAIWLFVFTFASFLMHAQDFDCKTHELLKSQKNYPESDANNSTRISAVQELAATTSHQYIELKNLVVLYKQTNKGTLHQEVESKIQGPLDHIANFYFRNSGMRLLLKWEILVVEEFSDVDNPAVNGNYIDNTVIPGKIQTDLTNKGITANQYDCIVVFTGNCGNFSYGAKALFGTSGLIQVCWLGTHWVEGAGTHEYNHFIDDMFRMHGYPDYPQNHPGGARQADEFIPSFGHLDAGIVRHIPAERWLTLATSQWGELKTAEDLDSDLVPDEDANLPIHEAMLNGSSSLQDTDNDGLDDLEEILTGIHKGSLLDVTDSDGDGLEDGEDKHPLYPVIESTIYRPSSINDPFDNWPLNGMYFDDHPEDNDKTELRTAYDDQYLYIGIKIGNVNTNNVRLIVDGDSDGYFNGSDNFVVEFNRHGIFKVVFKDAYVFDGNDHIDTTLPSSLFPFKSKIVSNAICYQLAIPKEESKGISLTGNEKIGIKLFVNGYGHTWGRFDWGASMFEREDYFYLELENALVVNAKGSEASGVYSHFKVLVDGHEIGDSYSTSEYKSYIFPLSIDPLAIKEIRVVFDNDLYTIVEDRNLFVRSIAFGGKAPIEATSETVTYITAKGQELLYNGMMQSNGALIFDPREKIIVHARGSQAAGKYAHFKVLVDGIEIGDAETTGNYESYAFILDTDPSMIQQIKVIFDNDTLIDRTDRNLYVKSITIEGVEMPALGYNVFYIRQDGQFIEYNGVMEWNGALLFDRYFQAKDCGKDVLLSSQYEVNTFSCSQIQGDLRITGSDIYNLAGLSELTHIDGGLIIRDNPALSDIDGLSALKSTGMGLHIRNNEFLENLDGLNGLESIGWDIIISDNNVLGSIDGLSNLSSGVKSILIENNHTLKNINGLSSIRSIPWNLRIINNGDLKNLNGLSSFSSAGFDIRIEDNDRLIDLNGLKSLKSIGIGWQNTSGLSIKRNFSITNLDGLSSLSGIKGTLNISENINLKNLDGLSMLNSVGEDLIIQNNSSLMRCCGLFPILNAHGISGNVTITGNGAGCSEVDILAGRSSCAELIVTARGTEAAGEYAHFIVKIGNEEIGDGITTSDYEQYRFSLSVDPSSIEKIQIIFDNDTIFDGEDRDLYIHSIEYGDSIFELEDLDVLYYDKAGNELNYDNVLPWNGTLVLDFTTPEPPITTNVSLCEGDTIPALIASGKNLKWYQDPGLKTLLHSGSNFNPILIDAGTYQYYVTQTLNGRESNPDTLTLIINSTPELPICSDLTYCEGDPIAELHAIGNNIRWYQDRELTNLISTGNKLNSESTAPGVYHYFPTQTISGCESDPTTLTLTIHKKPSAPICNDVIVCEDDSVIALQASGDSIHWYNDNQFSNLVTIGNSHMPVDIRPGKYSFYLSQVISGCAGYIDSVELTIKDTPAPPQYSNVRVCFGEEMPALTADGTNINWYEDGYLKNHLQSGNTLYSEHDQVGQYNYYVTQTLDACESRADTARLTIYSLPTIYIGEDTAIAFDAKITLAVADGFINYLWNSGSQENYLIVDGTTSGPGEYTFSLQVEDTNHCINSDTIKIAVLLPTSLDNNSTEELITVYPNPVLDHLHVYISNYPEGAYRFEMFDLSGKLQLTKQIYVKENNKCLDFDLSFLHKGVYISHFSINNTTQIRKKVVIQ